MNFKQTDIYLHVLQDIATSYNSTVHRTIDRAPASVKDENEMEVRIATYLSRKHGHVPKTQRYRFKIGDYVRISHLRATFTRAYDQTYSGEIFKICRRYLRGQIPVYRLKDMADEVITGSFYQSELQKISVNQDQMWKVETIIKTRGKGRNKQYFANGYIFQRNSIRG